MVYDGNVRSGDKLMRKNIYLALLVIFVSFVGLLFAQSIAPKPIIYGTAAAPTTNMPRGSWYLRTSTSILYFYPAANTPTALSGSVASGDVTLTNGSAIQSDTTTGHTGLLKAYDVDDGIYRSFATLTNGNTPSLVLNGSTSSSLSITSIDTIGFNQGTGAIQVNATNATDKFILQAWDTVATAYKTFLTVANGAGTTAMTIAAPSGGTLSIWGLSTEAQGDIPYFSAANTLSALNKDTNSTRYLSNQGTTNNPSWNQVNLANGVTGVLPIANGGTGNSSTALNSIQDFRLTLSSGNPIYVPQTGLTPSSTDTTAETTTFAAATGWTDGTICTVAASVGGLTAGTTYYTHAVTPTTVFSWHTSVAAALAGTSPVNLTANVTNALNCSGVSNTTLYISPYKGNSIALYDGSATWNIRTSAEFSIALGTLTSALPYDVFVYDNSTVPTAELLAWTSDTARATALVKQNGVSVKTGATTRRYIGTIRTDSTTTTIDNRGCIITVVGAKRFVFNNDNRVNTSLCVYDTATNQAYTSATIRQMNGTAGNQVEFILGLNENAVIANSLEYVAPALATDDVASGLGLDSTIAYSGTVGKFGTGNTNNDITIGGSLIIVPTIGYHYLAHLQNGAGGGTSPWYGSVNTGVVATIAN